MLHDLPGHVSTVMFADEDIYMSISTWDTKEPAEALKGTRRAAQRDLLDILARGPVDEYRRDELPRREVTVRGAAAADAARHCCRRQGDADGPAHWLGDCIGYFNTHQQDRRKLEVMKLSEQYPMVTSVSHPPRTTSCRSPNRIGARAGSRPCWHARQSRPQRRRTLALATWA